tara:strand:- start:88 stop:297 length:210 start_codon:yes stop_codon:yes gene_type:complete
MNKNYQTKDILSAIDILLNNKEKKSSRLVDQNKEVLVLKNEVKNYKSKLNNIPKDTEKIILQAEKYLKK